MAALAQYLEVSLRRMSLSCIPVKVQFWYTKRTALMRFNFP